MYEHVAVVGATGAVGRIALQLLAERNLPYQQITFLASKRSAGTQVTFRGTQHTVQELRPEAFSPGQLVIASTPDDVARDFIPYAVERGAVVVDESGYWRMDPQVPLVIPEVNPQALEQHRGIISSPNCSTTQLVVALQPLHAAAKVKRVIVS
ncbi:MAG: aspartate-semialdehyde dehydrogenase, partial [Planctomycetota bacterium]